MLVDLFFQIVPFLAIITFLITIHELGHYWVARACGVVVHTFSVGFGKTLWSYQDKKGVIWKISMIPLGGYVRMASLDLLDYKRQTGEISDERYEALKKFTMEGQSTFKRIAIAAAGPLMNIAFAFILLTGLFMTASFGARIICVVPDSPADIYGLQKGDALSPISAKSANDNVFEAYLHKGGEKKPITIKKGPVDFSPCNQDGKIQQTQLTNSIGILQEWTKIDDFSPNISQALGEATPVVKNSFTNFVKSFTWLILPKSLKKEQDVKVGGIISAQRIFAQEARVSVWFTMLYMANISMALAWFNLLPIPMLDGGHILIATIEGVARKRLPPEKRNIFTIIGLAFLLFLFILLVKIDLFG